MNQPNQTLNLLHKTLGNIEWLATSMGEHMIYLTESNNNGKNNNRIEDQLRKIIEWTNRYDEIENAFNLLLEYLQQNENITMDAVKIRDAALMRISHLEAVNKDAIFWKDKADFYKKSNHLLFNELVKERAENGKENKEHSRC
jgi:hypothetical protein